MMVWSGQFPCSNLGTVFEPSPLLKVVHSCQLLMKLGSDMSLINSAVLESCLSHHNSLEVASLAL